MPTPNAAIEVGAVDTALLDKAHKLLLSLGMIERRPHTKRHNAQPSSEFPSALHVGANVRALREAWRMYRKTGDEQDRLKLDKAIQQVEGTNR
jgi:hypothetical protein